MDKLFEQIAKILPPPFLVGLLALGITFFATYYARGYRAYGDVLHDAFLRNAAVAICAATVLFWMNADRMTPPESNPVVLIPFFANDEHDQYRTALSSQIEERLNAAFRKNGTVFKLPSFLNDDATAKQIAGKFHASAVLYEANVIDGKDTRMACFKLLQIEPELYKTYSLVPMSVPDVQMDEIVTTLRGSQTALAPDAAATNALLGRLQSLQSQVDLLQAELHDARTKTTEAEHGSTAAIEPAQGERRALIIAADSTPGGELPVLAFARSDAEHMSATLTQLGYKSMLLLGNAATHSRILDAIEREKSVLQRMISWSSTTQVIRRLPAVVREVRVSETMRPDFGTGGECQGLWEPDKKRIIVKRSELATVTSFAGTLLHEIIHANSG